MSCLFQQCGSVFIFKHSIILGLFSNKGDTMLQGTGILSYLFERNVTFLLFQRVKLT